MNARAEYFKTGDEVSFSCNEGFSSPHSTTTCQATKVWSPPPVCTEVTCKVPGLINGRYRTNPGNRETNEREPLSYNALISPICNEGYMLSTDLSQRVCKSDGQWSGTEVNCNPITCDRLPDTLANGYYDDRDKQAPFPYNYEIPAVCHYGYVLTQHTTRRCINPNTWSGTDPDCRRITCTNPASFSYGQYNLSQQPYDFGSVLVPTCHTGYNISNNVEKRICERPDSWSGSEPKCKIVECETPTAHNGTWDQPPMECVKIRCNDTSDVRHEHIDHYPELAIGENGTVSYNSEHIFLASGSTEVTCSTSRKLTWIKAPQFGKILIVNMYK